MKVSRTQFEQILSVLERVDAGKAAPDIPGRVGRYLLEYRTARRDIDELLDQVGITRRRDSRVSGRALGTADLTAITDGTAKVLAFPLGPVADFLTISEALGGVMRVRLWMKAAAANACFNAFRKRGGLVMNGDYLWTPMGLLTPGESVVTGSEPISWNDARCLKMVADDLNRLPHACEYVLDYDIGTPGIKYFRCVVALRENGAWVATPAFGPPKRIEIDAWLADESALEDGSYAVLFVYREPWSSGWSVVRCRLASLEDVALHVLTWADFQSELEQQPLGSNYLRIVEQYGASADTILDELPERRLLPTARALLRWIRGVR